ncbi:MAG: nucleotidyltransferase family protein [Gemmatimonadaceae bacterium]
MRAISRDLRLDSAAASEVLVYCLGMGLRQHGDAPLARLSRADWDPVLHCASLHKVAALLHHRLRAAGSEVVPKDVTDWLRSETLARATTNLELTRQLCMVLVALRDEGIPVIVLKGAYLAHVIYENIALRTMVDIDLLVRNADLGRTESVLLAMGYGPRERPSVQAQRVQAHHLVRFSAPGLVPVEVHWTIEPLPAIFDIDIDSMWTRAQPARVAGVEVSALAPPDLLAHLALHAAYQHRFGVRLRHLCDVAETLRHFNPGFDWQALASLATRYHIERFIAVTLSVTRALLGIELPQSLPASLRTRSEDAALVSDIRQYVLTFPLDLPIVYREMRGTDSMTEKLRLLLRSFIPARDRLRAMYGLAPDSPAVYWYYLARPADMLRRRRGSVWQMLRGTELFRSSVARQRTGMSIERWAQGEGPAKMQ